MKSTTSPKPKGGVCDTTVSCTVGAWLTTLLLPVSEALALAAGFLLITVSVPVSLDPSVVGAYWTVMLHDFFGPRLVPVQLSAVTEKAEEPVSVTLRALVALPPEFLSVNVCEEVVFASIVP